MPSFPELRSLCRQALTEITGERISRARAERIARVLISIWTGDEQAWTHADPTAREAIRRVMGGVAA